MIWRQVTHHLDVAHIIQKEPITNVKQYWANWSRRKLIEKTLKPETVDNMFLCVNPLFHRHEWTKQKILKKIVFFGNFVEIESTTKEELPKRLHLNSFLKTVHVRP